VKARGEHLVMAPGGTREALRPFWRQNRVDFGGRRGYLRLAQAHDLQIIPVVASGLDRTFLGLTDAKQLFGRTDLPAWLGVGLGGVWPVALPFPVKIRQRIGAPIRASGRAAADVHREVTETMQSMLDEL
jgi:1-acyl-sn-glycerol-3-phosphate acyltransferase